MPYGNMMIDDRGGESTGTFLVLPYECTVFPIILGGKGSVYPASASGRELPFHGTLPPILWEIRYKVVQQHHCKSQ